MPFFGHKSRREREWEEVRASAQDDLVALGEDIRSLDVDISMPGVSDDAKLRYEQALQAYQRASEVFDRAKRPEMGDVATRLADVAVLTSDNPRSEDPLAIIEDVRRGVTDVNASKLVVEPDRRAASLAVSMAAS